MDNFKYLHKRPTSVIDSKERKVNLHREVNDVYLEHLFPIAIIVTNGSYEGPNAIAENDEVVISVTPSEGYLLPNSISVVGASYEYDSVTGEIVLSEPTAPVEVAVVCPEAISPILANNSWAKIRAVCEAGNASAYWSLGDVKNVVGGDGYARPVMIVDMQGLYNKHVVFQFRQTTSNTYMWNASSNVDDDNCTNNYLISDMNTVHLVAGSACYNEIMSAELGAELTNTTVKVAKNWTSSSIIDVTNKLFLPAERELFAERTYCIQEEWDALVRYQYYVANDSADARKLINPSAGSNGYWWERSPRANTDYVCFVSSSGNANSRASFNPSNVAPCFSF